MVPLGTVQYVIHGADDHTVKPAVGDAYAALARAAGDTVTVSNPPGGHVEEIAPGTPSWDATAALILKLVEMNRPGAARTPLSDGLGARPRPSRRTPITQTG